MSERIKVSLTKPQTDLLSLKADTSMSIINIICTQYSCITFLDAAKILEIIRFDELLDRMDGKNLSCLLVDSIGVCCSTYGRSLLKHTKLKLVEVLEPFLMRYINKREENNNEK